MTTTLPPLPREVPIHARPTQAYDPDDTRKQVTAVNDYLTQCFLERFDEVELLLSCIGAGEHIVFYGRPGTTKTGMVAKASHAFEGSKFFHRNCFPTMPVTSLIGNIDPKAFEDRGDWVYKSAGRLPGANFGVLDEIGRLRGATQDSQLGIANERHFDNGNGEPEKIPLVSLIGTSNTIIEDDTGAFTDRFLGHKWVHPIRDRRNREKLMRGDFEGVAPVQMPFDQLLYAICYLIPQVVVPDSIYDALNDIYEKVSAKGIYISDRRLRKIVRLVQSHAFMIRGSDTVEDTDLAIVQYAVTPDVDEQAQVSEIVTSYAGATEKALAEFVNALAAIEGDIEAAADSSEDNRGQVATTINFQLKRIAKSINTAIEDANRSKQPTGKLEIVRDRVTALRAEVTNKILS